MKINAFLLATALLAASLPSTWSYNIVGMGDSFAAGTYSRVGIVSLYQYGTIVTE